MLAAAPGAVGAISDPFYLPDVNVAGFPIFRDPTGRTPVNPNLKAGEATDIFLVWGQSLAAFHEETIYSPGNTSQVQQINAYSNGTYVYASPGLGCTSVAVDGSPGGSFVGRLADKRIGAAKSKRFIMMSVAVAGSNIAQWAVGGVHNQRLRVAARRLKLLGLLGNVSGVLSQIGEADNSLGTSQAAYTTALASAMQTLRDEGVTAKIMNALSTTQNDGSTSANVRAAVTASINHATNIYAGPDTDTLAGPTNRDSSGSHLTAIGSDANAQLWMTALTAAGV